jgi:hypothetical protein
MQRLPSAAFQWHGRPALRGCTDVKVVGEGLEFDKHGFVGAESSGSIGVDVEIKGEGKEPASDVN